MTDNLQAKIIQDTAMTLSREIDKDILWEVVYKKDYPYFCPFGKKEDDKFIWLAEHIGHEDKAWAYNSGEVFFKKQEHLVLYILRWS